MVILVEIIMILRHGAGCVHTSLRKYVPVRPRFGGCGVLRDNRNVGMHARARLPYGLNHDRASYITVYKPCEISGEVCLGF